MSRCVYCKKTATTKDAIGLPVCSEHKSEADDFYHHSVRRNHPNDEHFEFCEKHSDLWEAGCERCEACSQHHYGMSVVEVFGDTRKPMERGVNIVMLEQDEKGAKH